jgi:membrane associated rhomboid family serine protease
MIPLRDENPIKRPPFFTLLIIFINVVVFLYELRMGEDLEFKLRLFCVIPYRVVHSFDFGVFLTFITSLFFHAGFFHLFGNMLYLWIFGNNIEDNFGHTKFLIFYFLCGITASFSQILVDINSKSPMLGASGAVSGILAAYLLLYPKAKILVLIPLFGFWKITKVPALYFLGFWILLQFIYGMFSLGAMQAQVSIAWFAHIGGFLTGLILLPLFRSYER